MFTSSDTASRIIPSAMPREKLPRLVYCMMAVVMTLVFQEIAPPTMDTAPTSAMDMESSSAAEELILKYVRETDCVLTLVTHSLQQARRVADEAIYFHKGRLLENGPAEHVLYHPALAETRKFLEFYGN